MVNIYKGRKKHINMETPLVSIIIPCFNSGNLSQKRSIGSNQTYNNWEIMLLTIVHQITL
jgi:hypothetical protein